MEKMTTRMYTKRNLDLFVDFLDMVLPWYMNSNFNWPRGGGWGVEWIEKGEDR